MPNLQPQLRVVTRNGRPVNVPAVETPEEPLYVSFTGLTEAQQRAALAGFPGGRRFVLVRDEPYLASRRSAS